MTVRTTFDGIWNRADQDLIADALATVEARIPLSVVPSTAGPAWRVNHVSTDAPYVALRKGFPVIVSASTSTELRDKLLDLTQAF